MSWKNQSVKIVVMRDVVSYNAAGFSKSKPSWPLVGHFGLSSNYTLHLSLLLLVSFQPIRVQALRAQSVTIH